MATGSQVRVPPEAKEQFLARFPEYAATEELDRMRASEFHRLDASGQIYLDYTGGGLYGESQVRRHAKLLEGAVLGNPHSINPTSVRTTGLIERQSRTRRGAGGPWRVGG